MRGEIAMLGSQIERKEIIGVRICRSGCHPRSGWVRRPLRRRRGRLSVGDLRHRAAAAATGYFSSPGGEVHPLNRWPPPKGRYSLDSYRNCTLLCVHVHPAVTCSDTLAAHSQFLMRNFIVFSPKGIRRSRVKNYLGFNVWGWKFTFRKKLDQCRAILQKTS